MPEVQPKTAKGRATRMRIVQACAELVAERGVAATSLDDVCERAHVSKSQLYHYFADRDDLLSAVVEATTDAVLAVQADELEALGSLDGFVRWMNATVSMQEEREARGGCPIGTLAGQLAE